MWLGPRDGLFEEDKLWVNPGRVGVGGVSGSDGRVGGIAEA